ncbi:MAG: Gfo/Idh/MocA family oxidoreductase [Thermodesulfovibrionales bacterium]
MSNINVAVIGVGYLGYHHARILHSIDGVNLIAVVDTDIVRAHEVSREFGCIATDNHLKILDDVDCCIVSTPTQSHHHIALDCIKKNKHVFIEKPITVSPDEALSLISMSQDKGVYIQVGHIERFNPVFEKAQQSGKKPVMFCSERLSPFLQRASNIDVTKDLLIHDIDIILTSMRKKDIDTSIKGISAYGACVVTDKPDLVIADIEFDCGITAHLKASRVEREKKRQMTIFHQDGYDILDFQAHRYSSFRKADMCFEDITLVPDEEPLRRELNSFLNALRGHAPLEVTATDAFEALKVADDINKVLGDRFR